MFSLIFKAALFLALLISSSLALAVEKKFHVEGVLSTGEPYEVVLEETPYAARESDYTDAYDMWGIDGGVPVSRVASFKVVLAKEELLLPHKFFKDLCNVTKVQVVEDENRFAIQVKGGDAAASFDARFTFNSYSLEERVVRVSEFPDEVWERTVFTNTLWNNIDN